MIIKINKQTTSFLGRICAQVDIAFLLLMGDQQQDMAIILLCLVPFRIDMHLAFSVVFKIPCANQYL